MLLGILKKRMKSSFIGIYKGKWKYENLGRGLRYLISSIKPSLFTALLSRASIRFDLFIFSTFIAEL